MSHLGEVPEWLNGAVSKTVVGLVSTVGSNPTLSAKMLAFFSCPLVVYLILISLLPRAVKSGSCKVDNQWNAEE